MPNDAKLGLVVGVGLVLTIAIIFFRKDLIARRPTADSAAASTINPVKRPLTAAPRGMFRSTRAKPASRIDPVHHVVQEGETLEKLAERYLGDPARMSEIVEANPDLPQAAATLMPGQTLIIPARPD